MSVDLDSESGSRRPPNPDPKHCVKISGCVCRRMYVKPRLEEESHLDLLRKSKAVLNNRQMFALKVSSCALIAVLRIRILKDAN